MAQVKCKGCGKPLQPYQYRRGDYCNGEVCMLSFLAGPTEEKSDENKNDS